MFEDHLLVKSSCGCFCYRYTLTVECVVNGTPVGRTISKRDVRIAQIGLLHGIFAHEQNECNGGSIVGEGVSCNYITIITHHS